MSAGRRVVTGHHENVRAEVDEAGHVGVEFLQRADLGGEAAVLARGIGLLVMDEEIVELVPALARHRDLLLHSLGAVQWPHACELGESAVHGINGERGGADAPHVFELGERGVGGEPPKRDAVAFLFIGEQDVHLRHELVHEGQPCARRRGRRHGQVTVLRARAGDRLS